MQKKQYTKLLKTLTLLYIEDEDNIRNNLVLTLNLIFKDVIAVANSEDALKIYKDQKIDIILSDINLPYMSGLEFSKIIRKENISIPIILLSAYTDTKFLLDAAKLKLISYLTKPINFDELLEAFKLGVDDILRDNHSFIELKNNISYNLSTLILYENDKEKDLTQSERKLLEFFIENRTRTISIEEIKNYVWEDSDKASDSAFKSLLNKLRQKIGQENIKNISGVGYHLVYE